MSIALRYARKLFPPQGATFGDWFDWSIHAISGFIDVILHTYYLFLCFIIGAIGFTLFAVFVLALIETW